MLSMIIYYGDQNCVNFVSVIIAVVCTSKYLLEMLPWLPRTNGRPI